MASAPPRRLLPAFGIMAAYWGMYAVVMLFFPFYVRDLGGSFLHVSSLSTVLALAPVIAVNAWTALRDHLRRTRPFVLVGTLAAALTMCVPFVMPSPAAVIAAVALLALVHCCVEPILDAHVTVTSGLPAGEAAGAIKRAGSAGFFLASLLGGWLYGDGHVRAVAGAASALERFGAPAGALASAGGLIERSGLVGIRAASALGASLCAAAFALALLLDERDAEGAQGGGRMDLGFILASRPLVAVCTTHLLLSAARFGFFSIVPLYLVSMGARESWVGYVNAVATLAAIAVLPRVGRLAGSGRAAALMLSAIGGYLAVFLALGALPLLPWTGLRAGLALLIWSVPLYVLAEVPPVALVAEHTSEGERARGMGALSFAMNAGAVAGPLAVGWLATAYGGFRPALAFAAAVSALALAYAMRSLPRGDGARAGAP